MNSTTETEARGERAPHGAVVAFVAVLVASAACFSLLPGDTFSGSLVQGAVLAAIALVGVGAAHPHTLRAPRLVRALRRIRPTRSARSTCPNWAARPICPNRCAASDEPGAARASRGSGAKGAPFAAEGSRSAASMAPESPNALDELDSPGRLDESGASGAARASGAPGSSAMEKGSGTLRSWGGLGAWTAYVLAVAAAAGFASVVSLAQGAVVAPGSEEAVATQTVGAAGAFALVALLCLLTGVFEEGVFRVLALDALGLACGSDSRGRVRAAFASAALFGLLHVSVGDVASASGVVSCAQLLLKPVQAGLFGLFMAAMYLRMRNLWTLAGVHAAFNLLSAGPLLLGGGVLQTYVTGSGSDLALLAVTTALLVPAAIAAVVRIR